MLYERAEIGRAGAEQAVVLARHLEMLQAAVAVMVEHESGVAARRAKADPRRLDQHDGVVGSELGQPARHRATASAGADDREIGLDRARDGTRRRRRGKGLVPAVPRPVVGQLPAFKVEKVWTDEENKFSVQYMTAR